MSRSRRERTGKGAPAVHARPRRASWGTAWRWGAVVLLIAICTAVAVVWQCLGESGPLNLVLITMDTTRADFLRCYGRSDARTPNIDRLAREGTVFLDCSSCSPMTLPSHASIMTGTYPYVHGARRNATTRLGEANETLAETLSRVGYETRAIIGSVVLDRTFGLGQGFDEYQDVGWGAQSGPGRPERKADAICADAIETLRSLSGGKFMLWLHFYDPHYPYEARRAESTTMVQAYADEVEFVDAQIGRLLREIEILGLGANTIVVLVGDHGEGLNQHGEWQHAYFVYESTMRVPLVLWGPGVVAAGGSVTKQVRTIDVAPTILDLLGAPVLPRAQGASLAAVVRGGEPSSGSLPAYGESLEAHLQLGLSRLRSLCVDGWKYIFSTEPELYHLATDPGETRNLIAEQPQLAAEMHAELQALIAGAPVPPQGEDATVRLGPAEAARLEALGYVATTFEREEGESELDRFEPQGAHPRAFHATIRDYGEARESIGRKQYKRAEQLLRGVVDALPDAALPLADLGHVLHRQGKLAQADQIYVRALTLQPGAGRIHLLRGELLVDAGKFELAVDELTMALAEIPDDVITRYYLGIALTALGRYDEAWPNFERALEQEPESTRVLHGMGVFYVRQNRLSEAAEMFRQALEIDPHQPRLQADLQRVLRAMEQ